jgi:transcriptional regulator of acetoin/glycerol metabolism
MADFVMVYLLPDGGEERFELTPNTSYRLGSKPDNDVVIPQKDVSRHHAVVRVHDGWFHVTDLKSKNGTFVNGNQTTAAEFRPGDMLALSSARLLFIEEGSQASTGSGRRDESGVGSTPSNQPQDETGQVRIHVGVDDVVRLMDVTARAMEHRALAEPLAWAVDHLDLDAALVVYRDPDGRVAVVSSAGDLGPLVGQPRILSEIAAGAIREGSGRSRIRHAFEVREDLLVAGARDHHVLILRYAGSPPAVLDVQAVLASVNTILSGDVSPGQQHGVDPSGDPENLEGILHGASDEISDVRRRAVAIAAGRRSARLIGENGAGKQRLARFIHNVSDSTAGRFVAVDLAAIEGSSLEAELFGDGDLVGRVTMARGGTLFLIGVETLSEHVQGRLSEVLDSFERQDEPVILITAVLPDDDGRPPKWQAVEKNRGCEAVEIPPLRRRRCDVPLIAAAVLAREIQHAGLPPTSLSPEVATMLTRYAWPGNVSELREEIIRAAVASGGGAVQVHHFSPSIREASGENLEGDDLTLESFLGLPLAEARDRFEGWLIRRTLTESGGNQSLAARRMGMSRAGLFKKIRKLDIDV